jgi:hypothetical protein
MHWMLGFIDRHPGWALLWVGLAIVVALKGAAIFVKSARVVADWLWRR